ncbi:hypothetical protein TVAGG3_0271000 [Trichomonas vaginalis G3]|nr:hypothetical protein TVAGG3_0271000 [Trichomonas vaginalis G3]KAI5525862.1 hypothetical protein TVAGG3_0271000 [Trichomonas vaginalis G3]
MFALFLGFSICTNYCLMAEADKIEHCTLDSAVVYQTFEEIKTNAVSADVIAVQVYNGTENTVSIDISSLERKNLTFFGDENSMLSFSLQENVAISHLSIENAKLKFAVGTQTAMVIQAMNLSFINSVITVDAANTLSIDASYFTFDTKSIQNIANINASTQITIEVGSATSYERQNPICLTGDSSALIVHLTTADSILTFTENTTLNLQGSILTFNFTNSILNFIADQGATTFALNIDSISTSIQSINIDTYNATTITLSSSIDTTPIVITNYDTLTVTSKTEKVPIEFSVQGNVVMTNSLTYLNISKMNFISNSATVNLNSNNYIYIKQLYITGTSTFTSTGNIEIWIDSFTAESVYYTSNMNSYIPFSINKTMTIIDSTVKFYFLYLAYDIDYQYKIGLLGQGITAEITNILSIAVKASYYKDTMPTDAEMAPLIGKSGTFFKSNKVGCSQMSATLPDTGVVGFTANTSILEMSCSSDGIYSTFSYKFDDYPSRVYPVFCYENCDGFTWDLKNGEFGSYITKHTIKAVLTINSDMADGKYFNFDGAVKNSLWINSSVTDDSLPKLNFKASSTTSSSISAIYIENVTFTVVGEPLSIEKAIFGNVKFGSNSLSVGKVSYLQLSKLAYQSVPSGDLTDYFLDVSEDSTITFGENDFVIGTYTLTKKGDTLPILAFADKSVVTIDKSSSSTNEVLRFGFLNNATGLTISFKVNGDWTSECLMNYVACTINLEFTTNILPILFGFFCTLNITASQAYTIKSFILNNTMITIYSTKSSTISDLSINGFGTLNSNLTTITTLDILDKSYGTIYVSQVLSNIVVPATANLDLGTTDISKISITLIIKVEEDAGKLIYDGSFIPTELLMNFSISEYSYGNISKNFYTNMLMLVSTTDSNLTLWAPVTKSNVDKLSTPNSDISISVKNSQTLIYALLEGYKPKLTYPALSSSQIAWLVIGLVFVLAFVGIIIYSCIKCKRNKSEFPESNEPTIDDIEGIDDMQIENLL